MVVAHRRAGKTVASLNHLIRDALRHPGSRYAYIAPTYKQSKNVAWDILKEYSRKIDGSAFNESELRVDFGNGARITLYGSDNPDALRGMGLWGAVFDEYSQQPSNIFTEIIRPALADHEGYAIWIGTPKGKNDFFRLYQHSLKTKNWMGILLTVDNTGLISQDELADSQAVMTSDEFNQEWYCSFDASVKGAYYAEEIATAREKGRIGQVEHDKTLPVFTFWDLGVSDSTAIGFFQKDNEKVRMIDYYENCGKGLDHYFKLLQDKGYVYGAHFAPHDIKQRELTTGRTRLETARDMGIDFRVLPKLAISDGINAGRLMFSRLWVDEEKCQQWLDYIAQYHHEWDDKQGMFKDIPNHDFTSHAADMYRYAAIGEKKMTQDQGAVLTDDNIDSSAKAGVMIKNGRVREDDMLYEKEKVDWRYT